MSRLRSKFFYGWWVIGACFLISFYICGIVLFGFTAFFEPLVKQFGWSYAQISVAASLHNLVGVFCAPLMGSLVDRWGSRRVMFAGIIVISVGFIVLSFLSSLIMFYTIFVLISIGFYTCSMPVTMTAVVSWFRGKMALPGSIVATGIAMGGLLVPFVALLIDMFGWQTAMLSIGLSMLLIPLPSSLLVRHRPEDHGDMTNSNKDSTEEVNIKLISVMNKGMNIGAKQALKSRAFWYITLGLMCQFALVSAVLVHVMPYLSSLGIARSNSSVVAGAITLISIIGRLSFGWLGDRLDKRRLTIASFILTTLGIFFFGYAAIGGVWLLIPSIILFGIGWGGWTTMISPLLTEYFGSRRFGTILGFNFGLLFLGGTIGPPVAGWVFDQWGSYTGTWFAFSALAIASVAIIASTPSPSQHNLIR